MKHTVLLICTGNSCRSQMAEAILNAKAKELGVDVQAYSAGSHPAAKVQEQTKTVLEERGYSTHGLHTKGTEVFRSEHFDSIITLCDYAAANLAFIPEHTTKIHTSFPDPYYASGTPADVLNEYRRVQNLLEDWVDRWLRCLI
ncbi:MAG: arsenate reductase ArsC [Candidatus Kapabacteria bacterium]|nr:arsenate reductase ArsC [Candidatus Kapabacteria bacterium]